MNADYEIGFAEGILRAADLVDIRGYSSSEARRLWLSIRALSPDPSYLDRVRNEAATARDNEWLKWLDEKLDCDSREEAEYDFEAMANSYAYLENVQLPKKITEAATAALEQERKRIQKAVGLLPLHVREIPGSSTAQSLYLAEDVFAAIGNDKK